jgi:hypothetical protein
MAAVYHRRFWPGDVDGTVAYVAPNSLSTADPAYVDFLEAVGTPACRQALKDFQHAVLAARAEVEPAIAADAGALGDGFETFGVSKALDYAVVEASFSFWQYGPGEPACADIPPASASAAELTAFLNDVMGGPHGVVEWMGDGSLAYFAPYFYQAATQLGAPAVPQDHLLDVLPGRVPADDVPERYPPLGVEKPWDGTAIPDVMDWVTTSGERILFVYGESDPWSARPFEPTAANDAYRYVVPGGNHGASIAALPAADRAAATAALRRWAALPAASALHAAQAPASDPWALLEGERGVLERARPGALAPTGRPVLGVSP